MIRMMQVVRVNKRLLSVIITMIIILTTVVFYNINTINKNWKYMMSLDYKTFVYTKELCMVLVAIIFFIFFIFIIFICTKSSSSKIKPENEVYMKPSGLTNCNESCYMNSMIQAVAASSKLMEEFDKLKKDLKKEDKKSKLETFINLIKNINNPRNINTCVRENTENLAKLMEEVGWKLDKQEDSFQLFSKVINSIQKEINRKEIVMPPKLELLHSFSENCNWNKVQEHLALALPLCGNFRNKPGVKLESLMDAFFEPSKIEDSSNEMQLSLFQKAPNVMILHIQANEWNDVRGEYIKPKYYIIYKDNMKYTFNIQMKKGGSEIKKIEVEYGLRAVVHHMGSVTGGHYVTYRVNNGRWYLTNDEQVEETSFNCDIIPYIMVYEKKK